MSGMDGTRTGDWGRCAGPGGALYSLQFGDFFEGKSGVFRDLARGHSPFFQFGGNFMFFLLLCPMYLRYLVGCRLLILQIGP
jgi:hypothetical protein